MFTEKEVNYILSNYPRLRNITKLTTNFLSNFGYTLEYSNVEKHRKRISRFLIQQSLSKNSITIESSDDFINTSENSLKEGNYYIITWQQNGTPVNENLLNNIIAYKNFLKAELGVILGRYKVPNNSYKIGDKSWDEKTKEFWINSNFKILDTEVLGNVKVTPTNKYPLNRIQSYTAYNSIVIGHPRLHLKVCPTVDPNLHKILYTTGAISLPNYSDTPTGNISYNYHKYGFVIIEVDRENNATYTRQVEADEEGNFMDLCYEVKNGKVSKVSKALGMVCGDTHHWHVDPTIDSINDKICEYFNIENLVLHDVVDGESCNHHIINKPTEQFLRYKNNENLIEKELDDLGNWLGLKLKYNPIIVQANHNSRFDKVLENDWRKDIPNTLFYLEYTAKLLKGEIKNGVVAYYLNQRFPSVRCLGFQESLIIGNYECSQHGDYGANGSRGSRTNFRNMEIPIILAHSHTPYRADDCIYAGTNTKLSLSYNGKGSSSWVQANVLIGKNNLAQHLIFKKGKFTTLLNL